MGTHKPTASSNSERDPPKTSPNSEKLGENTEDLVRPIVGIGHDDVVTEEKETEMMRLGFVDSSDQVPS